MADEVRQQEIGFWIGPQVSSNGDLLIHCYDTNERTRYAVATIYEEDFEKLPKSIAPVLEQRIKVGDIDKSGQRLDREKAKQDDYFSVVVPPWKVYVSGKKVVWDYMDGKLELPAQLQASPQASKAGSIAGAYVWVPLVDEQLHNYGQLASDEVDLAATLFRLCQDAVAEMDVADEHRHDVLMALFRHTGYNVDKMWPTVRGSMIEPVESDGFDMSATLDDQIEAVKNGSPEDFLDTVAEHPLITDANHAKAVLKAVGESGIAKAPSDRLIQAKKAWLYTDMVSKLGMGKELAVSLTSQAFDQIPF